MIKKKESGLIMSPDSLLNYFLVNDLDLTYFLSAE